MDGLNKVVYPHLFMLIFNHLISSKFVAIRHLLVN
jgi:hypothetical protein